MRSELEHQLLEASQHLTIEVSEGRAAAIREGIAPKARAKRRRQVLATALSMLIALAGTAWVVAGSLGERELIIAPTSPEARLTAAVPDEAGSQVAVLSGGAWFEVPKQAPGKSFRVTAGNVTVEVLGTRFLVERIGDGVMVHVDHGRVQVRWPGHSKLLTNGEQLEVRAEPPPPPPPLPVAPMPELEPEPIAVEPVNDAGNVDDEPEVATVAPTVNRDNEARGAEARSSAELAPGNSKKPVRKGPKWVLPDWKRLAEQGDFSRAFEALHGKAKNPDVANEPDELLLAADVARLSHHPIDAVEPLQRILTKHERDPRTPLAAFTLGRVLLDELGRPHEAAAAFAQARALAPNGPLAEDAMAREVEAASRAGDMVAARALAKAYEKRYPVGARLKAVRHHGGLE